MTDRVLLIEIQVTSPIGEVSTLRFSDTAIRPMPPTDALRPNVGFDDRIQEPPSYRRMLFDNLETLAPSIGVGALNLLNADRALDRYEGYAWGEIAVWLWTEGTPSAQARLILRGQCGQPGYPVGGDAGQVKVAFYDYSREASKPVQSTLYAGSNDGEGVLYEGAADGLKGTPKPLAWGDLTAAHIPAPLVNPAEFAHQLHDGAIAGPVQLFDRGDDFGLTDDGDLVGPAFDAATPDAAHMVSDKSRGLVKATANPVGQVTVGFKGASDGGYVQTAGPVLARILARAGVPAGRIGASVAALPAAAVVGFYAGEAITLNDALRFVAAGAPAAVLPDREGVWQASTWGPPAATADVAIGEHDILAEPTSDEVGAPIGEIRVGWGQIWRTFSATELAPDLAATDAKERLAKDFRWASVTDPDVQARFPGTFRTIEIRTALRNEADAINLASLLKGVVGLKQDGRQRRAWRVVVDIDLALDAQLGWTAAMDYPPLGLADHYLVLGEEPLRPTRDQAIWTLWG